MRIVVRVSVMIYQLLAHGMNAIVPMHLVLFLMAPRAQILIVAPEARVVLVVAAATLQPQARATLALVLVVMKNPVAPVSMLMVVSALRVGLGPASMWMLLGLAMTVSVIKAILSMEIRVSI
jgi:hypothetical protein